MIKIFKQKISPIIAFLFVLVFGYFSIYLMNEVFSKYAEEELLAQIAELKAGMVQAKNIQQ